MENYGRVRVNITVEKRTKCGGEGKNKRMNESRWSHVKNVIERNII
jgi:hypothetical protein